MLVKYKYLYRYSVNDELGIVTWQSCVNVLFYSVNQFNL